MKSGLIGTPLSFFHQFRSSAVLPGAPGQSSSQPNPSQLWGQQSEGSKEPLPEHKRWRRDRLMSGGGPVLDSGFHYCDSLRYFFGEVEKVYAVLQSVKSGSPETFGDAPEDTVFVTISFKSGVTGNWSWSLAAPGEEAYDVTFYGSRGSLRDTTAAPFSIFHLFQRTPGGLETARLTSSDGSVYDMRELEAMHRASLSEEVEEFFTPEAQLTDSRLRFGSSWRFCGVTGRRRKIDGWEGMRSLALGDAIYESGSDGGGRAR